MSTKKNKSNRMNPNEERLMEGIAIINTHSLFGQLSRSYQFSSRTVMGRDCSAKAEKYGSINYIMLNKDINHTAEEWAYIIAHCQLHFAFGHFDADNMPGYEDESEKGQVTHHPQIIPALWNQACDIFISKFLADIKFGRAICSNPADSFNISLNDEKKIYQYLVESNHAHSDHQYGVAAVNMMDMSGLENPVIYPPGQQNRDEIQFARALAYSASRAVTIAGGHDISDSSHETLAMQQAQWFINHYPLLGALATGFKLIEDPRVCQQLNIQIAAVDVSLGEIYINPAAALNSEELKFVLAHEFLHAGLNHDERCAGRDHYLWNIACDYVINAWLKEMQIGTMPGLGLLYDENLANMSTESIYDMIIRDLKRFQKLNTFRGYGKGDVMSSRNGELPFGKAKQINGVSIDEFYRNALAQGLDFHQRNSRGYLPAGLIEEIRALSMPPIPWDVKLAKWFDLFFPAQQQQRSYAKPSRRQASTPDIPRPRYFKPEILSSSRTFGVVLDTSGSMSSKQIGMALGSIASYAQARDVPFARVIFCDAAAYDAGYIAPQDIAQRVAVKGRGGTVLQPGIDLLEDAEDFPAKGPVLIITDGFIENHLKIRHEHAFLLPAGNRLPFRPKGEVFYFK